MIGEGEGIDGGFAGVGESIFQNQQGEDIKLSHLEGWLIYNIYSIFNIFFYFCILS